MPIRVVANNFLELTGFGPGSGGGSAGLYDLNPPGNSGSLNPAAGRPTPTSSPKPTPLPAKTPVKVAQKESDQNNASVVEPVQSGNGDLLTIIHDFLCGLPVIDLFCKQTSLESMVTNMSSGVWNLSKDFCATGAALSGGCVESIRRGRVQAQEQYDFLMKKQADLAKQFGPNTDAGHLTQGETNSLLDAAKFPRDTKDASEGKGSKPFFAK